MNPRLTRPFLLLAGAALLPLAALAQELPASNTNSVEPAGQPAARSVTGTGPSDVAAAKSVPVSPQLREQQAQRVYQALATLARQSGDSVTVARDLLRELEAVAELHQRSKDSEAQAAALLQQLRGPQLAALQEAQRQWNALTRELDLRLADYRSALKAAATARPGPARRNALGLAGAKATMRDAVQQQREQAALTLERTRAEAQTGLRNAHAQLLALAAQQQKLAQALKASAAHWAKLGPTWQAMQAASQLDPDATRLLADEPAISTPLPLAPRAPWETAVETQRPVVWQVPAIEDGLKRFQAANEAATQARDTQAQLLDAAAWLARLMGENGGKAAPRQDCGPEGCARWQDEAQALASQVDGRGYESRLLALQAAQDEAISEAFGKQPDQLLAALTQARQAQQLLDAHAGLATAQLPAVQSAAQQTQTWQRVTTDTTEAARQTWQQAQASLMASTAPPAAGASAPAGAAAPASVAPLAPIPPYLPVPAPEPVASASAAPVLAALPAASGAGTRGSSQLIDSALHLLTRPQSEPAGFGAYTYVVVATGTDRGSPGVRSRLVALSKFLAALNRDGQVADAARARTHLFVLPVGQEAPGPDGFAYDVRMAQALLSAMPLGWQIPDSLRLALRRGQGPFLVTLPSRIAEANAQTPVLFADLSHTPADAVPDVAKAYMGDLLDGFSPNQPQWKPSTMLSVALTLVRMAESTGEIVQSVFPSAMARSR